MTVYVVPKTLQGKLAKSTHIIRSLYKFLGVFNVPFTNIPISFVSYALKFAPPPCFLLKLRERKFVTKYTNIGTFMTYLFEQQVSDELKIHKNQINKDVDISSSH
jgi:hypothetical protein